MFFTEDALDLGRYTMEARRAVSHAVERVSKEHGDAITPEHLVLGALDADVHASKYVQDLGAEPATLQSKISGAIPRVQTASRRTEFPMQELTKVILRAAYNEAKDDRRQKVTSVDILIGVLDEGSTAAARVLAASGLSASNLRQAFKTDPGRDSWAME